MFNQTTLKALQDECLEMGIHLDMEEISEYLKKFIKPPTTRFYGNSWKEFIRGEMDRNVNNHFIFN